MTAATGVSAPADPAGAVPVDRIVALAQRLIREPSQGGVDDPAPILDLMAGELRSRGLPVEILPGPDGAPVAVMATVAGSAGPGPTYVLDACIDTAPVTDPGAWTVDPFAGAVRDGWLYGRGSADCKTAVAAFADVAGWFAGRVDRIAGTLLVLFDADEHTGRFGGVRAFVDRVGRVDGVYIGYPENGAVNAGARGFYRCRIETYGQAEHSGSVTPAPVNAARGLAALIDALYAQDLPAHRTPDFPLPPKRTVTAVQGGIGYSVVPDVCALNLDIRLTPAFPADRAAAWVAERVRAADAAWAGPHPRRIHVEESWPPYAVGPDAPLVAALVKAGSHAFGRPVATQVCGPSNIGNFLAERGIPATCGFGVTCDGVHGADERVLIDSIAPTWLSYRDALATLLMPDGLAGGT